MFIIESVDIVNFEGDKEILENWICVSDPERVENTFAVRNMETAENLCEYLNDLVIQDRQHCYVGTKVKYIIKTLLESNPNRKFTSAEIVDFIIQHKMLGRSRAVTKMFIVKLVKHDVHRGQGILKDVIIEENTRKKGITFRVKN